jgi:hypothetical protein
MQSEGWYQDPFELHTDRWFSDGKPTDLVRDAGLVSHDEPPADLPPGAVLVEVEQAQEAGGGDLKRADAATSKDQSIDGGTAANAVLGVGYVPWLTRFWRTQKRT